MSRAAVAVALALCLTALAPAVAPAGASPSASPTAPPTASLTASGESGVSPSASTATDGPGPRIVSLLPNPVAPDDAGEYVRVRLPAGNWTVTDGESSVRIHQRQQGAVVVTADADALVDPPPGRVADGGLSLSNAGERVALRRGGPDGPVVDAVRYGRAPEGQRWVRDADPPWRPVGLDPREPVPLGSASATAFVLPDAPGPAIEPIQSAEDRILLAGYTFASERVTEELIAAHRRDVNVRVLLDGDPVGGVTTRQARLLDRLVAAGIEVRVVTGAHARVRYHHAKYAVADDTAVVLTENWKPSGTGGADNRGWGVALESARAAAALAELFRSDAGWIDAIAWNDVRTDGSFTPAEPAEGTYPEEHPPSTVRAERATLLTAPGNAESGVVAAIDDADERVDVLQPTVASGPMLSALRRAAERGATVRLLVSNAWYVAEENAALVERLNDWADRAGVPLEARVADPGGRFGAVHAKGVVADDTAVVGSLNWNPTSARENREVAVALEGEAVAGYYRESFGADWRERGSGNGLVGETGVPPALAVAAVGSAAGAVLYARRRIAFGDPGSGDDRGPIG
ncbi:phospholipase D-like domain-containing protein [Halobaculum sp. CBA1158]|uniref:phospholipase D-like domain-containing protein n=1 Tax=Halobaculum sp. CBA1158 TaxID=2904243 RepID=UPI001F36E834|nr:phospholipase D-like domain-containing protein [Halobaculum sp. CBA1158]UIO98624.1 phospholipase D-like domain-containing protein [Halobaculum sp. CBA1158]